MLTQLQITSAKPKAKPYNLSDGQGLVLAIQTTGSRLWRFRYRYAGRQKTLHIGPWPATSLADAREACRAARKAIAAGLDPALEKKRARVAARFAVATTFKDVALEWIAKCEREGRAAITLDKIRWLLGMAYPLIGSHPINSITPTEALSALRKVEAKGRYESARRMRSVLSRVFRYGIATARCDRDVAADLRGALTTPRTVHHAAITDPEEVGILLKTMDGQARRTFDHLLLQGRAANGATVAIEVAGGRPPATPSWLDVVGDNGVVRIDGGAPRGIQAGRLRARRNDAVETIDEGECAGLPDAAANVAAAYAALRNDIVNGTSAVAGFDHAVRVTRVIEDALTSSRDGRRIAFNDWPGS